MKLSPISKIALQAVICGVMHPCLSVVSSFQHLSATKHLHRCPSFNGSIQHRLSAVSELMADTTTTSNTAAAIFGDILAQLDPVEHPITTILGSYLLVTASDMIPFVPCQPLAIALGAKLGFAYAFPVTLAGQTTAGLLAFSAARRASDSDLVQAQLQKLDEEALQQFQSIQQATSEETQDSRTILLGLIGLRLAPFFPFSAGNYLLGGATAVPLSLFGIATVLGCLLSNLVSTTVGAGGAALLLQQSP